MVAGVARAYQSHPHPFANHGVVFGDLTRALPAAMVEPAIADVGRREDSVADSRGRERGCHSPQFRNCHCAIMDLDVGPLDGAGETFGWAPGDGTLAIRFDGDINAHPACDLAAFIAAHSVGHDEYHGARPFDPVTASIFVVGTIAADIAEQRYFELENGFGLLDGLGHVSVNRGPRERAESREYSRAIAARSG